MKYILEEDERLRLLGWIDQLLDSAQVIRIQQLGLASESNWDRDIFKRSDAAWRDLNIAHYRAYNMLGGKADGDPD